MKTTQTDTKIARHEASMRMQTHALELARSLTGSKPKPKKKQCTDDGPCCKNKCKACLERAQEAGR